jgi:uncharacterized protein involved in exopolysaccharide biosynthesis
MQADRAHPNREILKYLHVIRKWWWVIVLLVGVTLGTMLVIFLSAETQYKATVTVQVSAPPPQEVPLYSNLGRQALRDEIEQTQSSIGELLQEGDVAYRVLKELPDIAMTGGELRQKIEVEIPENSNLMRVSVRAADPEVAALLANAVVETGLAQYAELSARPTSGMRVFIEQQLDVAQAEYGIAESELTQFQVANKIGSLSTALDRQYELIETLKTQRDMSVATGDTERKQTLDKLVLEREAELQNLIGLSSQYYTLVSRVDRARDTYNFMLNKKAEAQIKENQILELGSIQIITSARPPSRPAAAMNTKLLLLAAIASLIAGVLLAFLLEYVTTASNIQGIYSFQEDSQGYSSSAGEGPRLSETVEETG